MTTLPHDANTTRKAGYAIALIAFLCLFATDLARDATPTTSQIRTRSIRVPRWQFSSAERDIPPPDAGSDPYEVIATYRVHAQYSAWARPRLSALEWGVTISDVTTEGWSGGLPDADATRWCADMAQEQIETSWPLREWRQLVLRAGMSGRITNRPAMILNQAEHAARDGLLAVLAGALAWPLVTLSLAVRNRLRVRRGLCPRCAYDLAGLTTCPECGSQRRDPAEG